MSDAADFRRYAAQCMAAAKVAMDHQSRSAWLEMAQNWMRFADKAEAMATPQQQQQIQPKADKSHH
jgi:hypothetical protein